VVFESGMGKNHAGSVVNIPDPQLFSSTVNLYWVFSSENDGDVSPGRHWSDAEVGAMEESRTATSQLSNIVQHLAQSPPVLDVNPTSQKDDTDSRLDTGSSKQERTGGDEADLCRDISVTSKKVVDENVRAVDTVPVTIEKEAAVQVGGKSPQTEEEMTPKDETATETSEEKESASQVTEELVEDSATTDGVENATMPHTEDPTVAAHTQESLEIDNARIEMENGYGESDDVHGAQRPHSWKARGRCMPAAQPERGRPHKFAVPEGFGRGARPATGGVNRPYENQGPHHPWAYNSYDNSGPDHPWAYNSYDNSGPHHPGVNSPYGNLWSHNSHGNLGGPPYSEVNNPYDLGPRHQWVNNNPYGNLGSRDPGVGNPNLGPQHQWVNNRGVKNGGQHNLAVSGPDGDWRPRHPSPRGGKYRGRGRKGWRGRRF
jgi:hypothetical protein